MEQRTHLAIDPVLCGRPTVLEPGRAVVRLETTARMASDDRSLVHGSFPFGLADYAAMLAVNEPHVVLASAEVKFLAPVIAGDDLEAEAILDRREGRRHWVRSVVRRAGTTVLDAEMLCVVPDLHVLDRKA